MLRYMYTGNYNCGNPRKQESQAQGIMEDHIEMWEIARKYFLPDLKEWAIMNFEKMAKDHSWTWKSSGWEPNTKDFELVKSVYLTTRECDVDVRFCNAVNAPIKRTGGVVDIMSNRKDCHHWRELMDECVEFKDAMIILAAKKMAKDEKKLALLESRMLNLRLWLGDCQDVCKLADDDEDDDSEERGSEQGGSEQGGSGFTNDAGWELTRGETEW